MTEYIVKVANRGFFAGKVFVYRRKKAETYTTGSATTEADRLEKAAAEVREMLRAAASRSEASHGGANCGDAGSRDAGSAGAGSRDAGSAGARHGGASSISEAELLLLDDEAFIGRAMGLIAEQKLSAAEALEEARAEVCASLKSSGSEYIAARCEDVNGLAAQVTAALNGKGRPTLTERRVIAASELSPAELLAIDPEYIGGIITEQGSATSHVAVLASSLGIPYAYGSEGLIDSCKTDGYIILDADAGKVVTEPSEEMLEEAKKRQLSADSERRANAIRMKTLNTKTRVCLNISSADEARSVKELGADGIGLFRTELLFLNAQSEPSEQEQYEEYKKAVLAADGREVVIRTMDIGSDKQASWLKLPGETNPALGMRGLRVSLKNRDMFGTQLRALLRAAAAGDLKILVPMVTSEWELDAVIAEMDKAAAELDARHEEYRVPKLGVMIETPAAVMIAQKLAKKADFFSIGTNDLTQYTLALDREASGLDEFYDPMHDAVMAEIEQTVRAAHAAGIPAAVCGELGSDMRAISRLIALGADELSVSAGRLLAVREEVAHSEEKMTASKKSCTVSLASPVSGELIPMAEIPDEAFSSGMMGECVGIDPSEGLIYAPCSGTVSTVVDTKHAVAVRSDDGRDVLIHVGIDTNALGGEGFEVLVSEGERVAEGQLIMKADIDLIRRKGYSAVVILAVENGEN